MVIKAPERCLGYLHQLLLVCLALSSVAGCDPARRINMKNNSAQDAEIIWMLKTDSLLNSPFFMNNAAEVRFVLKPKAPFNEVRLSLGHGSWSPSDFKAVFEDVDSLIIRSHHGTIRLATSELKAFLWSRRSGVDKGDINIVIKD